MKLIFTRSIMKKSIEHCIKIANNKEDAKVWLKTIGKKDIFLYTQRNDKELKFFQNVKSAEEIEEPLSFIFNPYDMKELFKGKEKVEEWELDKELGILTYKDVKIEVKFCEGELPVVKQTYQEVLDAQEFMDMLTTIEKVAGKTVKDFTIGGGEATIRAPIYLKRFSLNVDIEAINLETEYLSIFNKTFHWPKSGTKKMETAKTDTEMFIKINVQTKKENEEIKQLYIIKENNEKTKVKNIEGEIVHTFEVDATELTGLLKEYKTGDKPKDFLSSVKDVYLYDWNGKLCIDPYDKFGEEPEEDEDQPIHYIDYQGDLKRTKVDIEGIKAFLEGTEGPMKIDVKKFEEHDETYFLLTSKTAEFYAVLMAKKEPNYKKVQEKVNEIIKKQAKISYL